MKVDALKNELKNDGYSKEERYFYELNLALKKNSLNPQMSDSTSETVPVKSSHQQISNRDRMKERAIERWENDGGPVDKSENK